MCGIAGIIDHSSKKNISIVDKMLEEIRYRGPDNKNSISGNFFDIGAVRLSIQDLSDNGNQPFSLEIEILLQFIMAKFIIIRN